MEAEGHQEEVVAWYRYTALNRPCFGVVDRARNAVASGAVLDVLHDHARLRTVDSETHLLTDTLDGLVRRCVRAEGDGRCRQRRAGGRGRDGGRTTRRRWRPTTFRSVHPSACRRCRWWRWRQRRRRRRQGTWRWRTRWRTPCGCGRWSTRRCGWRCTDAAGGACCDTGRWGVDHGGCGKRRRSGGTGTRRP